MSVLFAWAAVGHLLLLALAELFPRYVFAIGPRSPWFAVGLLALVLCIVEGDARARAQCAIAECLAPGRRRRALLFCGAFVLLASALASRVWPAGVEAEIVHSDGRRTHVGRRGDFDVSRREVLALGTHVGASLRMQGHLMPAWAAPWSAHDISVTRWQVSGRGTLRLDLDEHNRIRFDNRNFPDDGVVKLATLPDRGTNVTFEFAPEGTWGDGRVRVVLSDARLAWHLFSRPLSMFGYWLVSVQRLLLAFMVVALPLLLALLWSKLTPRLQGSPKWPARLSFVREAAAALLAAAVFAGVVAPRVDTSAEGDQAAFLNWADYFRERELVQPPPSWFVRWNDPNASAFVALALHVVQPPREAPRGQWSPREHGPRVVNGKPIGLSMVILALQALGGEQAGYFASLVMTALGALATYAALRISALSVVLSALGAACLALGGASLHCASVLDPDAAAAAWTAVFFLGCLLLSHGTGWALLAGAALGMAVASRYNQALAIVLALPFLFREPRRILPFVLGGLPFLVGLLVLHWRVYGHPLAFPYTTWAQDLVATSKPYFVELGGYVRAVLEDLSPVVLLPFLAYPFLSDRPRHERVALASFAVVWLAFFGAFPKVEPFFLRYMLPLYPVFIFGSLHVWSRVLASTTELRRAALVAGLLVASGAWIGLRPNREDGPPPPRSARVAAAWVDYYVPPDGALLTNLVLNATIYYYSGRRQYPLTLKPDRPDGLDLRALRQTAEAAGDLGDWFLLWFPTELDEFKANYPELQLDEVRRGFDWRLYRVLVLDR